MEGAAAAAAAAAAAPARAAGVVLGKRAASCRAVGGMELTEVEAGGRRGLEDR